MRQFKKILTTLILSVLSGYILLTAVYFINNQSMLNNTKTIIKQYNQEEVYQPVVFLDNTYLLDNFTDSLMIAQAIYKSDKNPFIASMANERFYYEAVKPSEGIEKYINNQAYTLISYARYWHGYLIFLKPLLSLFNYFQIRTINLFVQTCLLLITLFLIFKKINFQACWAFIGSVLVISPYIISLSLQFSGIYYITLLSCIYILLKIDQNSSADDIAYIFLIIGIMTSYFDLLTYPLVTFGIPLSLTLLIKKELKIKNFIFIGLYWIIGYLGMWFGKWLLSSLVLNTDVISLAMTIINSRTSNIAINEKVSRLNVIITNYQAGLFKNIVLINTFIFICNLIVRYKKLKFNYLYLLYFIFIAVIPIVWLFMTANHSSIHYYYTYRIIIISVFAVHCLVL